MVSVPQAPLKPGRDGPPPPVARATRLSSCPSALVVVERTTVRGLVVGAQGTGAVGGGLAEAVVQQDAEVAVAWLDLAHEDVGAVVPEGVGGAVEGLIVAAPPGAADACRRGRALPSAPGATTLGGRQPRGLRPLSFGTQVDPVGWGAPGHVHPEPVDVTSLGKRGSLQL